MSEPSDANNQQHDDPEAPNDPRLDASFKVDSATMSSEESDFAKQMGFGEDGHAGARDEAQQADVRAEAAAVSPPVEADEADEGDASEGPAIDDVAPAAEADEVEASVADEAACDDEDARPAAPSVEAGSGRGGDWEEIAPRAASEGIQAEILERADELLGRTGGSVSTLAGSAAGSDALVGQIEALEQRCVGLEADLRARDDQLDALRSSGAGAGPQAGSAGSTRAELEKALARLEVELDGLGLDRDQLIDELASARDQLARCETRAEGLEASLRGARGALTPLPEGERALRAEVVGLRGRLEDSEEEHRRLRAELSERATELAIAQARVEDRQHEVDAQSERVAELETTLAEHDARVADALDEHREMLALSTRLQAENNELRSTQVALEETLQARDLEIAAREEHLTVTRQGLAGRDAQVIDLAERLAQEQQSSDAHQSELERRRLEIEQLEARVARRESRIASLTDTLRRVEEAVGSRLSTSGSLAAPRLAGAIPPHAYGDPDERGVIEHEDVTLDLPRDE